LARVLPNMVQLGPRTPEIRLEVASSKIGQQKFAKSSTT